MKIYYQEHGLELNDSFLENLDLFTVDGRYNYVAYLLADVNSVSIKVAKYAGKDKCELIENEEYGFCSLIKATERVLDKLEIENKTYSKVTGSAKRLEHRMIDRIALREAFINAIVHNDYSREVPPVVEIYSNRLVITSYGGLVEGLSIDDFFSGRSMPRNRELMRIFRDLDLVEHLGSGMHRILKSYSRSIFNVSENFLEIIFPYQDSFDFEIKPSNLENSVSDSISDSVSDSVNDSVSDQIRVLVNELIKDQVIGTVKQRLIGMIETILVKPSCRTADLAALFDVSEATIWRDVKKLNQLIKFVGSQKTGGYQATDFLLEKLSKAKKQNPYK